MGCCDLRPQKPLSEHMMAVPVVCAEDIYFVELLDRSSGNVLNCRENTGCGYHFWFCKNRFCIPFRRDGRRLQEKRICYITRVT